MRFVNVRELKSKTSEVLRAAAEEDIVVTNRGKPVAIVRKFDGSEFESPSRKSIQISSLQPARGQVHETRAVYEPKLGAMNPLKAVFWDYPELTEDAALSRKIQEARDSPIQDAFRWYLARFLERGRAVDTLRFFRLEEIRRIMPSLRITQRAIAKWTGILEYYGNP